MRFGLWLTTSVVFRKINFLLYGLSLVSGFGKIGPDLYTWGFLLGLSYRRARQEIVNL